MSQGTRRSSAGSKFLCLGLALVAHGLCAAALAAPRDPQPVPGRLIVQLDRAIDTSRFAGKPGGVWHTGRAALDALAVRFAVRQFEPMFPVRSARAKADPATAELARFFIVEFPPELDLELVRQAYAADPAVTSAEYDWMHYLDVEPNDLATSQWYLQSTTGIDAHVTGAWNHSRGDTSIVLAIADSGVDWEHPDLGGTAPNYVDGNIWINWAEYNGIPGNDDDGNGFVDDIRGWDFVSSMGGGAWPGEDAALADNDPRDFNGHGTHVAGIASATTNNGTGIAGVGYDCKVMALRIGGSVADGNGNEQGVVFMSYAAQAINYARSMGAVAVNCSWGSSFTSSLASAVNQAVAPPANMVIVVAAGNDNANSPSYLGSRGDCFDIGATANNDARASFSNFGGWVDVMAPGVDIFSTYFNHTAVGSAQHTYVFLQGTSMAAPLVTGIVGLVKAANPSWTDEQVMAAIEAGCDNIDAQNPGFSGLLGAGRVNALKTFGDRFLTVPDDYPTFTKALNASSDGDTLALEGGTVLTSALFLGKKNRVIQGGWDASFTTRDTQNPTTIDPTGGGPVLEFAAGMDSTLVVEGLRLTGGTARNLSSPAGKYGGGLLCIGASPVLRDCVIEGNAAGDGFTFGGGGGALFFNSSARVERCVFRGNTAREGGGVYVLDADVQFVDCQFDSNTATAASGARGGGVFVTGSVAPQFSGGTITGNSGFDQGGGVFVDGLAVAADGMTLSGNAAISNGGNARVDGGTLTLTHATVRGGAANFGAGIDLVNGATLDLQNTVVAENTAAFLGGGIYATAAQASLVNTTFHANNGGVGGGDAVWAGSSPVAWTIRNSIFANHTNSTALVFSGTAPALDFNVYWNNLAGDLSGGVMGPNGQAGDPAFVSAGSGDFELGESSAGIDRGDPDPLQNDPDGSRNNAGAHGGPGALTRAPLPPTGVAGTRAAGVTTLTWSESPSLDVDHYAVYRGPDSLFVPTTAEFVGTAPAGAGSFADATGQATDWYVLSAVDSSGAASGFTAAIQPTSNPTDTGSVAPARFVVHQNEPNPFNPSTRILLELPQAGRVQVDIFDGRGRRVRRLVDQMAPAGVLPVTWDGRDDHGRHLASGVYVYRVITPYTAASRKMTLVR